MGERLAATNVGVDDKERREWVEGRSCTGQWASRKGASQSGKDALSAPGQDMQIAPRRGRWMAIFTTRSWNNLAHHACLQTSVHCMPSPARECECGLHRRCHDSTSSCHRCRGSNYSGTRGWPINGRCLMKAPDAIPAHCEPRGPVQGRTLAAQPRRCACPALVPAPTARWRRPAVESALQRTLVCWAQCSWRDRRRGTRADMKRK